MDSKSALCILLLMRRRNQRRSRRRIWIKNIFLQRETQGHYNNLISELRMDDEHFFQYMGMSVAQFDFLLSKIGPDLKKQDTSFRKAIEPGLKLAITLRFLASGDSQVSLSNAYRVSPATVSSVIDATLDAIWTNLCSLYLPKPSQDQWRAVSTEFWNTWHFPHCLGALDGKYIAIQRPSKSGSSGSQYNNINSIALMALCDASYSFLMIDVGSLRLYSSIFNVTELSEMLRTPANNFPPKEAIVENGEPLPYVVVADEAFPLLPNLMRPYPGRNCSHEQQIFNYRLSRARRTIENTFGIMASRWRIYKRPIIASPEKASKIVRATAILHNFLRKDELSRPSLECRYCPSSYPDRIDPISHEITPGQWRANCVTTFSRIGRQSSNRASSAAQSTRDHFKHFFNNSGVLPGQSDYVKRVN